ncbi:KTSC domain-containing protein [Myroides sp. LJL119]
MKRVIEFRKVLGVDKTATLQELKNIYRNAMKASHPDKFANDPIGLTQAEQTSKTVIEAYHFLVSIHPETHQKNNLEYEQIITGFAIHDFFYEKQTLKITHFNGVSFEYLGVPRNTYIKMVNADSPTRFAKRHIYGNFVFRKSAEEVLV